jgi:hypothetical protein
LTIAANVADVLARAGLPQSIVTRMGHQQRAQAGGQLVPYLPVAQLGEQAPGQQQIDHHPRRQHPDPGLGRAGGRQRWSTISNGTIWVSSPR